MNKYQFKDIQNVFVTGDCHGEFKSFFNGIKTKIFIKKEDEDKIHPMEVERLARKKAKQEAVMAAQMNMGNRPGRMHARPPHDPYAFGPQQPMTTTSRNIRTTILADLEHIKKNMSNDSFAGGISPYSNAIIFVTGDCGFGFNKEKYYINILEKYNKILAYNNTYVIFVRGNHDDPSYFDGEKINFSNIKAVPDYSIIETKNKNILCVGGAISTDRTWRIEQEKRINSFRQSNFKSLYWPNEAPVLDKEKMDEMFGEYDKIDYVISHTAPSFVDPMEHPGVKEWEKNDKDLNKDINNERLTMDRIFEYLRDNDRKPTYWAYGHFDFSSIDKRSNTLFRALSDGFNPINIEFDICVYDNASNKPKLKKKKNNKKTIEDSLPDHWAIDETFNNVDGGIGEEEAEVEAGAELNGVTFDMAYNEPILEMPTVTANTATQANFRDYTVTDAAINTQQIVDRIRQDLGGNTFNTYNTFFTDNINTAVEINQGRN